MGEDQHFCLRWNTHQSTIVSVFSSLLANEQLTDVTLAAEGGVVSAHKVVLSACSPYFQNMLIQCGDRHPIIVLKDIAFCDLKILLEFMYRGEVSVGQQKLQSIIQAAESLQIRGLTDDKSSSKKNSESLNHDTQILDEKKRVFDDKRDGPLKKSKLKPCSESINDMEACEMTPSSNVTVKEEEGVEDLPVSPDDVLFNSNYVFKEETSECDTSDKEDHLDDPSIYSNNLQVSTWDNQATWITSENFNRKGCRNPLQQAREALVTLPEITLDGILSVSTRYNAGILKMALLELLKEGRSVTEVTQRYGIKRTTIYHHINKIIYETNKSM